MLALIGALAPHASLGSSRAAQPLKLPVKSATAFPAGRGPLTIHGDAREFVILRPDFKSLKRAELAKLQAAVLHWPVVESPGPIRQTNLIFLRLLKPHPSAAPKPKVDWDPVPVIAVHFAPALDHHEVRISGFALAMRNWASGKWPDYGMLVALRSESRAAEKLTLAPASGPQAPYFELRWPEPLPPAPPRR